MRRWIWPAVFTPLWLGLCVLVWFEIPWYWAMMFCILAAEHTLGMWADAAKARTWQ